ncbi:MAG TPA: glycosyltransferase family 1 protein [Spirochaetia bacterium]|nr:glycosyltransferase family 1 protein [Spirochaetia bacterium]
MNIGFDINEANIPQRVGVNQVAYNIFLHLVKQISGDEKLIALGKERPLPDMPVENDNLIYEIFGAKRAWVLTSLTKRLWFGKPKIDVLFSPSHYTPLFSPTKTIIYLMDMSFERFGTEYFTDYDINQLKKWTPLSVKKAKKVLTISEFSKNEIIKLYGTSADKIDVVYPAFDKEVYHGKVPKTKIISVKKKYGISGSYFLYWGTLQPRKNITRLIDAFAKLDKSQLKLVICGKKGWLYDQILEQSKTLGIDNRVIFTGFAPNDDLPALIKGSRAFVLPSLYEGFGMPAVEAQAVGTPIVVSRVSSLPEVAGESAIYIEDPESVESIKNALERVLALSIGERLKLIKEGKENTKRFDWDISAQKILSIIKTI